MNARKIKKRRRINYHGATSTVLILCIFIFIVYKVLHASVGPMIEVLTAKPELMCSITT